LIYDFKGKEMIVYSQQSISDLMPDGKALLSAERFSQVPVFETWDGLIDIDQVLAAGIDDLSLLQCRHPWAASWFLKESAANSTIISNGSSNPYLSLKTSATDTDVAQIACTRSFMIGFTGQDYFGPKDERLIFETILRPEAANETAMDWFVGIISYGASAYLPTPELPANTTVRFGFAIDGDTNIYGISADGTTGEVTADHDLTNLSTIRYLRAIYDIGNNIKFYVDNTLIGTLSTNLPVEPTSAFLFFMYIQNAENADKQIKNYGVKIRWQNGATP